MRAAIPWSAAQQLGKPCTAAHKLTSLRKLKGSLMPYASSKGGACINIKPTHTSKSAGARGSRFRHELTDRVGLHGRRGCACAASVLVRVHSQSISTRLKRPAMHRIREWDGSWTRRERG